MGLLEPPRCPQPALPTSMAINLNNHKAFDSYYAALATYRSQDATHEQATSLAFSTLLDAVSKAAECFAYRLGNRSALEWVIDQYQSAPTSAAASPATPIAPTTRSTSCSWSAEWWR